jgi:hypothetical protein
MTQEFDHVREAFARSVAGRLLSAIEDVWLRAWRSSAAVHAIAGAIATASAASSIRMMAVAVTVAAIVQPLLIRLMPLTVAPAVPWWAYGLVAVVSTVAATQAEALATSWPASRLRRLIGR